MDGGDACREEEGACSFLLFEGVASQISSEDLRLSVSICVLIEFFSAIFAALREKTILFS